MKNTIMKNSIIIAVATTRLLTLAVASLSYTASAATVNIDFNSTQNGGGPTYSGLAVAPDTAGAGAQWNGFSNNSFANIPNLGGTNLLDSTGVATTIDLTVGTHGGGYSGSGNALLNDYLYLQSGGTSSSFTLSGLSASEKYDVYIYSTGDVSGQGGAFSFGATTLTTSANPRDGTNFILGNNYVVFNGVTPDGTGSATFNWVFNGVSATSSSGLNGIQVEIVPEPSAAFLLIGSLGMGLLVRRRRK